MLGDVQGTKSAGAPNGWSEQCAAEPTSVLNVIVGVVLLENAAGLVVIERVGAVVSMTNTLVTTALVLPAGSTALTANR